MPIERIYKTYNHVAYYEMAMKKKLEDILNVDSANNTENKAVIKDQEEAAQLAAAISTNEKIINKTKDLIMHEYHEGLVCKNILSRNTAEYIVMREKLKDINALIKQFANKELQVMVYYDNCINMRDEATAYKKQFLIDVCKRPFNNLG